MGLVPPLRRMCQLHSLGRGSSRSQRRLRGIGLLGSFAKVTLVMVSIMIPSSVNIDMWIPSPMLCFLTGCPRTLLIQNPFNLSCLHQRRSKHRTVLYPRSFVEQATVEHLELPRRVSERREPSQKEIRTDDRSHVSDVIRRVSHSVRIGGSLVRGSEAGRERELS